MGYDERDNLPMSVQPWPKWAAFGSMGGSWARAMVWTSLALAPMWMLAGRAHADFATLLFLAGLALAFLGGLMALARRPTCASLITAGMAAVAFCIHGAAPPFLYNPGSDRGKQSKSLNNIRQLGVAAQMYAQDNGGAFPGWANDGTKASPRYVHNVWDQQIAARIKSKDVFSNGDAGIRSPSQPGPNRDRVLAYGINGAVLAGWARGHADFAAARAGRRPAPFGPETVSNPAGTILFAELATGEPMDGLYGQTIPPEERPRSGGADWTGTKAYDKAHPGWIDIDPRAFCELATPLANNYQEPYEGATGRGIARNLYSGGACYAFCDGHIQFLRLAKTVGIGQMVGPTQVSAENCWSPLNTFNMWNPNV